MARLGSEPMAAIPATSKLEVTMTWYKLNRPMDESTNVDPADIVNTKRALNSLGYYTPPFGGGFGDWVDNALFSGIRQFQRDNGLKVDGMMKPGGATESTIRAQMASRQWNRQNSNRWNGTQDAGPRNLLENSGGPFVTTVAAVDAAVVVHAAVAVANVVFGRGNDTGR